MRSIFTSKLSNVKTEMHVPALYRKFILCKNKTCYKCLKLYEIYLFVIKKYNVKFIFKSLNYAINFLCLA